MATSIARGRLRTTTTTAELSKMAAILQIIGWWDTQPWFTVYFFDICHPCYDQLTLSKQGIRWPVSHDHIAGSSFKIEHWPNDEFSIGSQAHVTLTCWKQDWVVWTVVQSSSSCKPVILFLVIAAAVKNIILALFLLSVLLSSLEKGYKPFRWNLTRAAAWPCPKAG